MDKTSESVSFALKETGCAVKATLEGGMCMDEPTFLDISVGSPLVCRIHLMSAHALLADMITDAFASIRYRVVWTSDFSLALARVRHDIANLIPPAGILVDVPTRSPSPTLEFVAQCQTLLRETGVQTKTLLFVNPDSCGTALSLGTDHLIVKPFHIKDVLRLFTSTV